MCVAMLIVFEGSLAVLGECFLEVVYHGVFRYYYGLYLGVYFYVVYLIVTLLRFLFFPIDVKLGRFLYCFFQ